MSTIKRATYSFLILENGLILTNCKSGSRLEATSYDSLFSDKHSMSSSISFRVRVELSAAKYGIGKGSGLLGGLGNSTKFYGLGILPSY